VHFVSVQAKNTVDLLQMQGNKQKTKGCKADGSCVCFVVKLGEGNIET
jgi:hypothetical protein